MVRRVPILILGTNDPSPILGHRELFVLSAGRGPGRWRGPLFFCATALNSIITKIGMISNGILK